MGNPYEPAHLSVSLSSPGGIDVKAAREQRLYRLVKLLFWMPIVIFVPVFLLVRDTVPDMNHGSIGDGFRKLNIFFSAMFPVGALCWLSALGILTYIELPKVPKSRLLIWLALLMFFAVSVALCW